MTAYTVEFSFTSLYLFNLLWGPCHWWIECIGDDSTGYSLNFLCFYLYIGGWHRGSDHYCLHVKEYEL